MMNGLWMRVRAVVRRGRVEGEMEEELRFDYEQRVEKHVRAGMTREEARRQARLEVGGAEGIKEECREARGVSFLETLAQDVRYALQMLRKSPGFTVVAILTLAVGIGADTAIFSIVNAVLLRPLPFKDSSRLVLLHEGLPKIGFPKLSFEPSDLAVFEREQKSFSALGTFVNERENISGQGEPDRIMVSRVSGTLFPMLGTEPMMGRNFSIEEDAPGHQVAILSYALWQRRYGGNDGIIGQQIQLDRQPYIVIGVMPRQFQFPPPGAEDNGTAADLWVPMATPPAALHSWGGPYMTTVVGRLRPGVTLAEARAEVQSLGPGILASYPASIRIGVLTLSASPFQEEVAGSVRTLLLVLMAAVSFVLLIACANVATLLLSRAATRQKEIAIRTTLGATRFRLARQMLTESLLLGLAGGVLGFVLAVWMRVVLLGIVPSSIPLPADIPLSRGVFAFAVGGSILAAILFGLAPALQVSSPGTQAPLQESGRGATASAGRRRAQGFFVTAEFALALVLLVGAGLLIRSFAKLLGTNPGFHADHLLTLNVPLPSQAYSHGPQVRNFYEQLLDKAAALPGVKNAAVTSDLPLRGGEEVSFGVEGRPESKGLAAICQTWVMGNYFQTFGIPLIRGRWFGPEDRVDSLQVAVVSAHTAQAFWPGENPIGKRIRWGGGPWDTVVGVAGDVSEQHLDEPLLPHVYRPYNQAMDRLLEADPFGDWHAMNLVLRTETEPLAMTSAAIAQVHALDPDLAVANIKTMTQVISSSAAGPKFNTFLLGTFAGVALFLAAIGVYGVLAYSVAQQTHEIGIRMALGAQPAGVMRLMLSQGARLALIGSGIGMVAAFFLMRLMASLLYGVSPTDPVTFAAVAIVLTCVALAACYIPARRAMRVDPMTALRHE